MIAVTAPSLRPLTWRHCTPEAARRRPGAKLRKHRQSTTWLCWPAPSCPSAPIASTLRTPLILVHSCPFVSTRVDSCSFVVQSRPFIRTHSYPFVSIRVHSWFNPHPLHSCRFESIRGSNPTPSFVPIRVHSWFNPAPLHFLHAAQHPPHSCPFVSIRGSKLCPIRVHSWFKTLPNSCRFVVQPRRPVFHPWPRVTPQNSSGHRF